MRWLGITFRLPAGWVLDSKGCAHPANPPVGAPIWLGCTGISVESLTSDPAHPSSPQKPGQAWYGSTGVLPCPYPDSRPNDVVFTPGTLAEQGDQTLGGVPYRWYKWSATCNLAGEPGSPVVRSFDAQVWWIPSAGVAFTDVTGHPELTAILGTVRVSAATPGSTDGAPSGSRNGTAELAARCLLSSYLHSDATTASTCVGSLSKTLALFRELDGYDRATLTKYAADFTGCVPAAESNSGGQYVPTGTRLNCEFGDAPSGDPAGVWIVVTAAGPPFYVVDIGPP